MTVAEFDAIISVIRVATDRHKKGNRIVASNRCGACILGTRSTHSHLKVNACQLANEIENDLRRKIVTSFVRVDA